jgi:hypothetical protein
MERNPSILMTSAGIVLKILLKQTSQTTTLNSAEMMRITTTHAAIATETSPLTGMTLTRRATARSRTMMQATTAGSSQIIHKKRKDDVGHKSPSVKKRKTLVEPILGLKKIPKKTLSLKLGGPLLDDVFENDVSNDNEDERLPVNPNKKSVRPSLKRKVCPTTRSDSIIDGPCQWN